MYAPRSSVGDTGSGGGYTWSSRRDTWSRVGNTRSGRGDTGSCLGNTRSCRRNTRSGVGNTRSCRNLTGPLFAKTANFRQFGLPNDAGGRRNRRNPARLDEARHLYGVHIYARLVGQTVWTRIALDTSSPYIDGRPLAVAGVPEHREYMLRGCDINEAEVGQDSDIVSITFGG